MYCKHFGLSLPPFSSTPDPRFFFETPDHEEALASLQFVAQERKGFAMLTGEVGTGKTLVSRMVLSRLPAGTRTAVITHSRIGGPELLAAICDEFEIRVDPGAPITVLMQQLERYLLEQYARDRVSLVVLDEAQNLPTDALEQLRMLGNLEAEDAKLMQVLILGQPELLTLLAAPGMRQLRQRIYRTFHLRGLSVEQTAVYIQHRLNVAGAGGRRLFSPEAMQATFKHSNGLPRLINQICDNAMLSAYSQNINSVSAAIIGEVADHIPACSDQRIATATTTAILAAAAAPSTITPAPVAPASVQAPQPVTPPLPQVAIPASIPVAAAAPTPVAVAAAPAPREAAADPIIASDGVRYRMADIEAFVKSLSERQVAADRRLEDVVARSRSAGEDRTAAEAFMDQAKTLRDQAASLVKDAQTWTQSAQSQLGSLLESARTDTDTMRTQIAELLTEIRLRSEQLTNQSMDMVAVSEDVESSLTKRSTALAERQSADAASLRRDLGRVTESMERRWAELQQRQDERLARIREELSGVRERFDELPARQTGQSASLASQIEKLVASARNRIDQVQEEFLRAQESARSDLHVTVATLTELRESTRTESQAWREQMRDVAGRAEAMLVEVREQARAAILDVTAQQALVSEQGQSQCVTADHRLGRVADELARMLNDSREHSRRIRAELDDTLSLAETRAIAARAALGTPGSPATGSRDGDAMLNEIERRSELARAAIQETAAQQQEEARRLQATITEALTSGRESLASLLADAQREITRARQEARDELLLEQRVTSGRAGVANEAAEEMAERLTTATQAARAELADAETRADELRRGLSDIVKEAKRRVDAARQDLDEHMNAHATHAREFRGSVESDMATSGREATVLIDRAQAEVRAAAAALDRLFTKSQETKRALDHSQSRGEQTQQGLVEQIDAANLRIETARAELTQLLAEARSQTEATASALQPMMANMRDAEGRISAAESRASGLRQQLASALEESAASATATITQIDHDSRRIVESARGAISAAESTSEQLTKIVAGAEELKGELSDISRQVPQRVENAKQELDRVLQDHVGRVGELRTSTEAELAAAGRDATVLIERAQSEGHAAAEAVDRVLARADSVMGELREQITRALASTEERIKSAMTTADAVSERLEQRVQAAQQEAQRIRDQVDAERTRLASQAQSMEESSGAAVARTAEAVEELSTRAQQTVATLRAEVEALQNRLSGTATQAGEQLALVAGRAAEHAERLRTDAERAHADLAERATGMQEQAAKVLARAEASVKTVGEQSRQIHSQLRATMSEMTERGTALREQILTVGREAAEKTEAVSLALKETTEQSLSELAAQREATAREADIQHKRVMALYQQVDSGAESVRQTATALLADAQTAATRVREQASQMLEKSHAGAERLGEQAAALLTQAQAAAERFREQASELMRRTDAITGDLRRQTQGLRDELQNEIAAMQSVVSGTSQEAKTVHVRSEELLSRTNELTQRTQQLMVVPQEILTEATQRSSDLRNMSKSLETAVVRLAQVNKQAEHRAAELTGANQTAEEKMGELTSQTARVGQLVSVLRQVYQSMDARIEQLRDRLGMAEEIARGVPRDIEDMRAALGDARQIAARPTSARGPVLKAAPAPAARTTRKPAARSSQTLGEVVQKNTRLNEWLRQVIAKKEQESQAAGKAEATANA